ncbi:hypothetical protein OYC64_013420 [Pagothenia borchgrevinki]|uniref:C-type lectin domain-containing protein n=1 Tax=Pagothenia borchgrevinki TaxID=8213 RepID=A0ABD2FU96_PAGBO
MKVLKGALLLLLLLAVANAKPDHHHDHADQKPADPDPCQVLKMLGRDDLQQILGDWVLVWSVSEHQQGQDIMRNVSSSHVEMRLQEDNQTLTFTERNRFSDNKFINYYINMSMELLHNPNQIMHPIEGKMEVDGVLGPYKDTGIVNFYEMCPNCMTIVFKTSKWGFLLNYRKEGHYQDVDHMTADHDNHREMAECLGFDHDQPYIYDGVTGLALGALYSSDEPRRERRQTNCPSSWSSYNSRCYKYMSETTTWARAEIHCVSQGGHLVSIHSTEEDNFVTFLVRSSNTNVHETWIGLNDIGEEGRWVWSDGSATNFFVWQGGEPTGVGEECVHNNFKGLGGDWNDYQCSAPRSSVCATGTPSH